jgi:hypothetical protein
MTEYKIESYIQTPVNGKKRVVVNLFKVSKEKVKSWYLDFDEEE